MENVMNTTNNLIQTVIAVKGSVVYIYGEINVVFFFKNRLICVRIAEMKKAKYAVVAC